MPSRDDVPMQTVAFESFLSVMLERCARDNMSHNILEQCLNVTADIADSAQIRGHIEAYCIENQDDSDEPLSQVIQACNLSLAKLATAMLPLRDPDHNMPILLHYSRRLEDDEHYDVFDNVRQPEILVVPLARACAAAQRDLTWDEALGSAVEGPQQPFRWSDVFAFVDLRRGDKRIHPRQNTDADCMQTEEIITIIPKNGERDDSLQSTATLHLSEKEATMCAAPVVEHSHFCAPAQITPGLHGSPQTDIDPDRFVRFTKRNKHYAVERLSQCECLSSHCIGLIIFDDLLSVTWYDHQGVIHTEEINFIQNFPHFLVLLACFQRFTLADWGIFDSLYGPQDMDRFRKYDATLETGLPQGWTLTIASDDTFSRKFVVDPSHIIHSRSNLAGCFTMAFAGRMLSGHDEFGSNECTIKFSFPDASLTSECDIIKAAYQRLPVEYHMNLPEIICSQDFTNKPSSTNIIRSELGLLHPSTSPSRGARVLRVTVYRRLYPIERLPAHLLVLAWLDCLKCHFHLWKAGIEHRDINTSSLMFDTQKLCGVINNFELARDRESSVESEADGTGTLSTMASDLLCDMLSKRSMKREYRHDRESFMWSLILIVLDTEGVSLNHEFLHAMSTSDDVVEVWQRKLVFIDGSPEYGFRPMYAGISNLLRDFLRDAYLTRLAGTMKKWKRFDEEQGIASESRWPWLNLQTILQWWPKVFESDPAAAEYGQYLQILRQSWKYMPHVEELRQNVPKCLTLMEFTTWLELFCRDGDDDWAEACTIQHRGEDQPTVFHNVADPGLV